jgi:hypothetical protein
MRYLANNPQLIDRLANSYPIRRAAQLTVYLFHRSKAVMEDHHVKDRALKFKGKFTEEMKKEWEKIHGGGRK